MFAPARVGQHRGSERVAGGKNAGREKAFWGMPKQVDWIQEWGGICGSGTAEVSASYFAGGEFEQPCVELPGQGRALDPASSHAMHGPNLSTPSPVLPPSYLS